MELTRLQPSLERQLGLLGYELVCLERDGGRSNPVLRLYIDHVDGRPVTMDDCTEATEGLLAWMDVEFPSLRDETTLEVSSPGIERPLVKSDHYRRFMGRLCRIQTARPLEGQKRFKGWIVSVAETDVTIEEDGRLKTVPFEAIQKARLAPFDEAAAPPPRHIAAPDLPAGSSSSPEDPASEDSRTAHPTPFAQA